MRREKSMFSSNTGIFTRVSFTPPKQSWHTEIQECQSLMGRAATLAVACSRSGHDPRIGELANCLRDEMMLLK